MTSPDVEILGVLIPIIAITLGIALSVIIVWTRHRARLAALDQRHRERMAAIEKGVELPPELPINEDESNTGPKKASRFLLRGLVCLGIGAALLVSAFTMAIDMLALPGYVLVAIGLALTIYYVAAARNESDPRPAD
jgi:hypothetical protein